MNNKKILEAIDEVSKEKRLDINLIFDALELALASAYRKNFNSLTNVKVNINHDNGKINVYSYLTVVEDDKEDFDENTEITLTDAKKIKNKYEIGDTIDTEVTPRDFNRVAALTAKQVVLQKIREAERNEIMKDFSGHEGELMMGTVDLEDTNNFFINFGRISGILPKSECIPGEMIKMGSNIKVYVSKVTNDGKSVLILLSRKHFKFVERLMESEIPEIVDGTVLIHGVARLAGERSKVAVSSTRADVDPVGACIGLGFERVNKLSNELNGEKIDIVQYDENPETFIENALKPADGLQILISEENNEATVFGDKISCSTAIGKKGINVKLASTLTKYHIDIKVED